MNVCWQLQVKLHDPFRPPFQFGSLNLPPLLCKVAVNHTGESFMTQDDCSGEDRQIQAVDTATTIRTVQLLEEISDCYREKGVNKTLFYSSEYFSSFKIKLKLQHLFLSFFLSFFHKMNKFLPENWNLFTDHPHASLLFPLTQRWCS